MVFYIYKIENLINGKIYLGKTNNPKLRWNKHKTLPFSQYAKFKNALPKLYPAIRKYGIDNFDIKIIYESENEDDCYQQEIIFINNFNSIKNGYNTAIGGRGQSSGFKHTPEAIQKISQSHLGENNHFFGKKHSEDSIKKMSETHKIIALRGEDNPNAKLTSDQVKEIRYLHKNKIKTIKEICEIFATKKGTIKDIVTYKTWKHI